MSVTTERKVKYYKQAREAFEANRNIVQTLIASGANKSESIELAYELQAGDYTRNFDALNRRRNAELHSVINRFTSLAQVNSVGVLGVGEAMNWIGYKGAIETFIGIELSHSRCRFAHDNLSVISGIKNVQLFKGDATQKILQDNCVDLSITMHSIEPNGNEQGVIFLDNVISSSAKYVLLFEPDFSTAHDAMKTRMIKHDYVRVIDEHLATVDSIVVNEKHILHEHGNKDNLTTCWVIEKKIPQTATNKFVCPISGEGLEEFPEFLYSRGGGLAYPRVGNSICLNKDDAIFIGDLPK